MTPLLIRGVLESKVNTLFLQSRNAALWAWRLMSSTFLYSVLRWPSSFANTGEQYHPRSWESIATSLWPELEDDARMGESTLPLAFFSNARFRPL